jgi:O-antigen ligase
MNFILNGIIFIATIVATGMIVQFLLGDSLELFLGPVQSLQTQGTMYEDVMRVVPPGWSLVLVSFVTILCILVQEKLGPLGLLKFLQCGLLGSALLVTFFRSYWAALIMVIVLLAYLLRGNERRRLIGWGVVVLSLSTMILLVIFSSPNSPMSRLAGASMDRLTTLGDSKTYKGKDGSFDWRMIENRYALHKIASHPLLGIGMNASYRPWDGRLDFRDVDGTEYDLTNFIHNGHLKILLQSGLLGYLSLMWLSLAFLMRGFRYWRKIVGPRMRGVVLGFTLVYLAVLIASVANSSLMQWNWTPVIGLMMGINEVILMKFRQEESVA